MKLQIKVTLLIIMVLIVIGTATGGSIIYFQQKNSVRQFEHMARALTGAVQASLEQGMLTGESKPIQDAIVRISEEEMVSGILLLSPDGRITASNNLPEINSVSEHNQVFLTLRSGKVSVWHERQGDGGRINVISAVLNKQECQACHSPESAVLGGIEISLDTTSLDNQQQQQTIFFAFSGGLALFITGISLTWALRRIVLKPLSSLAESAEKLSRGDYAARTRNDANDEIGLLSLTFNDMAEKVEGRTKELELSQRELTKWNEVLEMRVQERVKEISSLNSQLKEMNHLREQLLEKLISTQEEERRRIAMELHDEASQSLAALVLALEDVGDNLPIEYQSTKQRLEVLKEQALQTLGGLRNLALELRPIALDDIGLARAIEWYAKDYLGKRGLSFKFELTGDKLKMPSNTETMLFRIIQEALTNVVKHAEASQVSVKLQLSETRVVVQIEDNGKGFDVNVALSGETGGNNLGLYGMMERATLLGGTMNIRSQPGLGTSLNIDIPLTRGSGKNE